MKDILIEIGPYELPFESISQNLLEYYENKKRSGFFKELKLFGLNTEKLNKKEKGDRSKVARINVHQMMPGRDANYEQIFYSINPAFSKICLKEKEIVDLLFSVEAGFGNIREKADFQNCIIHCLVQKATKQGEQEEFFVYADGLDYPVTPLKDKFVRRGVRKHIFVVPAT